MIKLTNNRTGSHLKAERFQRPLQQGRSCKTNKTKLSKSPCKSVLKPCNRTNDIICEKSHERIKPGASTKSPRTKSIIPRVPDPMTEAIELNGKLCEAMLSHNMQEVLKHLTRTNQWIPRLKMWSLEQMAKLSQESDCHREDQQLQCADMSCAIVKRGVQFSPEQMKQEVTFLKSCLDEYATLHQKHSDGPPSLNNIFLQEDNSISLKDQFHFQRTGDFVIETPEVGEGEVIELGGGVFDGGYLHKFQEAFRAVLEYQYGHLSEDFLFGDPNQGNDSHSEGESSSERGNDPHGDSSTHDDSDNSNRVVLLDNFKHIKDCDGYEQYLDFFRTLFDPSPTFEEFKVAFEELISALSSVCSDQHIQQMIAEQVTVFCYYLIESRVSTMQIFEKLERDLHDKVTSYDFLKTPVDEAWLNKVAKLLAENEELNTKHTEANQSAIKFTPEKKALYSRQCEVYQALLQIIQIRQLADTSKAMECLQSASKNHMHYSYLQENLNHLAAIFAPMRNRYDISLEDKDGSHIFHIKMAAGTFSGFHEAFEEWMAHMNIRLVEGDEIRVYADTAIYADKDLTDLSSISIACLAPKIECKTERGVNINTDGKKLSESVFLEPVATGEKGTKTDKSGKPGSDGENGRYGNAGGNILFVAEHLVYEDFHLSANGSEGEDGQKGGCGGDGWSATRDGRDGAKPEFTHLWYLPAKDNNEVIINYGTYGEDGGQGGDGGMGGAAGKSGISGKIELIELDNEEIRQVIHKVIEDGKPGLPGNPGKGGKHTKHGKDYGGYVEHSTGETVGTILLGIFTLTIVRKDDRKRSFVRGDLEHNNISYCPGSGREFKRQGIKGIPRQNRTENHSDFNSRGNALSGKKAQTKVNHALAKENKAIDKHDCFNSLCEQYSQSLQHWNANSHNHFLGQFAQRIGASWQGKLVSLAHSEVIKRHSNIWVTRIKSQSESLNQNLVQQTTREMQRAQIQTMKDMYEKGESTSLGYFGSKRAREKPVALDLTPLKIRGAGKKIDNLTVESILTSDKYDTMIGKLLETLKLSDEEIVVSSLAHLQTINHKRTCKHLIVQYYQCQFYYYHCGSIRGKRIDSHALTTRLEDIQFEPDKIVPIQRDYSFYSLMCSWICTKIGQDSIIPTTYMQQLRIMQLQLLVAIRKTFRVIIPKYHHDPMKFEFVQKLYAQCVEDTVDSMSLESIMMIQQHLVQENLIILPLDMSWTHRAMSKLNECVAEFNKAPVFQQFLKLFSVLEEQHFHCLNVYGESYLRDLSEELLLSKFRSFSSQVCKLIEMFCNDNQIADDPPQIPTVTSSQTLLDNIQFPEDFNCQENTKMLHMALVEIIGHATPIYTIIDAFFKDILDYLSTFSGFGASFVLANKRITSKVPSKLAYQAFRAFPTSQTVQTALSAFNKSSLPKLSKEIEHLSSYVFYRVQPLLASMKASTETAELIVQLNEAGLSIEWLYPSVKQVCAALHQANAITESMLHILELVYKTHYQTTLCDLKSISSPLFEVPNSLKLLQSFCENVSNPEEVLKQFPMFNEELKDPDAQRKTALDIMKQGGSKLMTKMQTIMSFLSKYPLSCPVQVLLKWERSFCSILAMSKSKVSETSFPLEELNDCLCNCIEQLIILRKLNEAIELIKVSQDLEKYSSLCGTEHQCEKLIQSALSLNEVYTSSPCLTTLSHWLYPSGTIQTPLRLEVQLERLHPQYKVFVHSLEPKAGLEINSQTIVLYQDCDQESDQWNSYSMSSISTELKCKPVCGDGITSVLGHDIQEKLQVSGIIQTSPEEAAKLLPKLDFAQEEFQFQFEVKVSDQILVQESKASCSIIVVNLQSVCMATFKCFDELRKIKQNEHVIVAYCQCTPTLLQALKEAYVFDLSNEQLADMQSSAAAYLIKHPQKPAIIHTVTKCSVVNTTLDYMFPLVTDAQVSSPLEVFQPISDLLNKYAHLYQSCLLMEVLNSSLTALHVAYSSTVYASDIPDMIRELRRTFMRGCVAHQQSSSEMLAFMSHTEVDSMLSPHCTSIVLEDVHLTGLEYYLQYLLLGGSGKTPYAAVYLYKRVLQRQSETETGLVVCLCSAIAYFMETERTEFGLKYESALNRYQTYCRIYRGLECIKESILQLKPPRQKHVPEISQLMVRVSTFKEHHKFELFLEVSDEMEDKHDPYSLLCLIRVVKPLYQQFRELEYVINCTNEDTCSEILSSTQFYSEMTVNVIGWCYSQQHKLTELLQVIMSDHLFENDDKKDEVLDSFTSWLMNELETAIKEWKWENVQLIVLIAQQIIQVLQSDVKAVYRSLYRHDGFNFLSNLLTIIQVITVIPDLKAALNILKKFPAKEWLSHLLTYNFMNIIRSYFGAEVDAELYHELVKIDTKLLQIFYNVFVNDQYNKAESENPVGTVSLSQLKDIIELLHSVETCTDVYTTLCRTSLSLWEKELAKINFKQYLDNWQNSLSEADKQRTMFLMNRIRVEAKMRHQDFMSFLITMRNRCTDSPDSAFLVPLFEDMYYKRVSLNEARTIIIEYASSEWSAQFEALKAIQKQKGDSRSVVELLNLIKSLREKGEFNVPEQEFAVIEEEAKQIATHLCSDPAIDEQLLNELQAHTTLQEKANWLGKNRVRFVVHIVCAWKISKNQVPYNTQIISLLLFLHTSNQGLLQQVRTGEGKTLIVGMLSAAKALLGYNVDIVSSNRDLAQDGRKKCQPFFTFLGLQAAVNCTDDDGTNQQAYRSHIVYGDVGSFQRDVLNDESQPCSESDKTDFSVRYTDVQRNCLVVDEVDSMFLDKGRHMLYLSHESPALKHLESLFIMIWSSVLGIDPRGKEKDIPIDTLLSQLADELCLLIENKIVSVPEYLVSFCKHKMKEWVRSAYQARFMQADDQFIIDQRKPGDHEKKQVFPIDKQTGIEQYNMKWSNGLSQFLELKYRRPLSTESLKAVFISNKRFFKRYSSNLYGLTGTLGSVSSRQLLENVYRIRTVELPTNRAKRYTQQKSRLATGKDDWCSQIQEEMMTRIHEQPVLVICENIKKFNILKSHLEKLVSITVYARDGHDVEEAFKEGAKPGNVVLATNKGGRGTDIIINETEAPNGLHVIVSFLPENTRIEEQAFGRAARAGQAGSGCLIIQIDPGQYQDTLKVFDGSLEAATETLVEMEKIKRDQAESDRLGLLLDDGLPKLDLEENLYLLFQHRRKIFESQLESVTLFGVSCTNQAIKTACTAVVTDHWAYWLDSERTKIQSADTLEKREQVVAHFNEEFPESGPVLPTSETDCPFFKMPEDYIQLGQAFLKESEHIDKRGLVTKIKQTANRYYERVQKIASGESKCTENQSQVSSQTTYQAALICFERAIGKGDKTGLPAMTACYCYIKLHSTPTELNKKVARRYLKKAKSQLDTLRQGWMTSGEVGRSLSSLVDVRQYVEKEENHYTEQIEEKLKVIGLHLNTLESLIGSSVDPSSFVNESDLSEEKISEDKSKEIYNQLKDYGIISHNRVRRFWKKPVNHPRLERLVKQDVDSLLADGLIELIKREPCINESNLMDLVYGCDELWGILNPLIESTECVVILEIEQVAEKLSSDDLDQKWGELKENFQDHFHNTPTRLVLPVTDPLCTALTKDFDSLHHHLKDNALLVETRRGLLVEGTRDLLAELKLGKYEHCKILTGKGDDSKLLRVFLAEVVEYCTEHEAGYLYEHLLPYGTKQHEARKIHVFLQEREILKSGHLAKYEYEHDGDKLEKAVKESIKSCSLTEQKLGHVVKVAQGLQGEVRSFEREMKCGFVDFYDLEGRPEDIPESLDFFTSWHMDHFLTLKQADKGWWDWNAFACAMIGLAQVIAGAALVVLTAGAAAQFGGALIAEGINDMVYATIAGLTGTFSWKDWAIQKAISIAISIATAGIGALASYGKAAAKVGSPSTWTAFGKVIAKAAGQFALGAVVSIISDVVLAEAQRAVVTSIIDWIKKNLFTDIRNLLRSRLVRMAKEAGNADDFHTQCKGIQREIANVLGMSTLLPSHFDQIRSQVASCLQQNYDKIADSLSKTNAKWAKVAGNAAKATLIANKIYKAVSEGVKIVNLIDAIRKLVDSTLICETVVGVETSQTQSSNYHKQGNAQQRSSRQTTIIADCDSQYQTLTLEESASQLETTPNREHDKSSQPTAPTKGKGSITSKPETSGDTHVGSALIDRELSTIEGVFLDKLEIELQQKLKGALEQIIRGSLVMVAKAAKTVASKCVKKAFKDRSPSDVVKDLHSKRTNQNTVADHPESIHAGQQDEHSMPLPDADQHASSAQNMRDDHGKKITGPKRLKLLGGNPGDDNPNNNNQQGNITGEIRYGSDINPDTLQIRPGPTDGNTTKITKSYKQYNKVYVEVTDTYRNGHLIEREGYATGMQKGLWNGAPSSSLDGQIERYTGNSPREREHNFHPAPALHGLGNTPGHGTSVVTSGIYNWDEKKERRAKVPGIQNGDTPPLYKVDFKYILQPINEIGDPAVFVNNLNTEREKRGWPRVDPTNTSYLQERFQMLHDKYRVSRVTSFRAEYTKTSDGSPLGTVKMGPDYEFFMPRDHFCKPQKSAEHWPGEIKKSKPANFGRR